MLIKRTYRAILIPLILLTVLAGCNRIEPAAPYNYEINPKLNWGYALFYGNYYQNYEIESNVLTLNLFSDKLYVNEDSELEGYGQFLVMEDVFVAQGDTLLPSGTYHLDDESGEPFTFFGGKRFKDNHNTIPSGAYLYYIEREPLRSKTAYIEAGNMTVGYDEAGYYQIIANFTLDDKTEIRVEFKGEMPHIDQTAEIPESSFVRRAPLKLKYPVLFE